ncbi:MAG TPA: carboxypeptidase-like regulatory domain-containing protein, partial [Candidatus Paceibacterota bacterium]|nr:carboxypeptidase-like regulatory domain-containing protein [Candidatus Paceibacterota bacterium]
ADGNPGFQDNSGGGSGGSIWIKAGKVSGDGIISAEGGSGEFFLGGGGGGGRIAIYSPANTFTGLVSVVGGPGANDGADGTVFLANDFTPLQVTSHSPAGVVSNFVSSVDFNFTEVVSANSLNVTNFTVIGPDGPLSSASFILSPVGLATMRVCFRTQNLPGDYQVTAGPDIFDLFGQPMSQVYTGAFTIVLPAITGTVMDTNGVPVPGVFMQPSYGLTGATTDTNGNYAVNIPIGWTGTITPSLAPWCFAPGSITYTGITGSISNQNFLAVPTIAPNLTSSVQGANLTINWHGLPGINYQVYQSTNLFDWEPYGSPVIGSNAPVEFPVPIDVDPQRFFRIDAGN